MKTVYVNFGFSSFGLENGLNLFWIFGLKTIEIYFGYSVNKTIKIAFGPGKSFEKNLNYLRNMVFEFFRKSVLFFIFIIGHNMNCTQRKEISHYFLESSHECMIHLGTFGWEKEYKIN